MEIRRSMEELLPRNKGSVSAKGRRTIRHSLKVIFSCLTALPFFVFAFIHFNIGTFNTALSGALIVLALILVLEGFIVFRRMAEHIEQLSGTMAQAEEGKVQRVWDAGETKELSLIADTFNRTLTKLEETARNLGVRAIQASTLHEVREIVSKTIQMEEVARLILERAAKAVNARAGYLAVINESSQRLIVAASLGMSFEMADEIEIDPDRTLAGLVVHRRSPILIEDIEQDSERQALNKPDMGVPRLLYLPVVGKDASLGVLALGRDMESAHFEEGDLQFLQTLLQQVAYGFENARLYRNLLQSKKELEIALDTQKRTQEHLLASARMAAFGELAVNIAHELNNPLTGILGYANLLLDYPQQDEEAREYMEMIQAQALRASLITKSLLDFVVTKPGSRVEMALNDLLQRALALNEGRISDHGIRLALRLADNLPLIMVDPAQMEQVFVNLISNALNALTGAYRSPMGAEKDPSESGARLPLLRLETAEREGKIYVSFKDNGPGIAPADLPKIFEPFYSNKESVSQVGLGLWVSQGIVKVHGGVIRVRSEPGRGSHFMVILPCASFPARRCS